CVSDGQALPAPVAPVLPPWIPGDRRDHRHGRRRAGRGTVKRSEVAGGRREAELGWPAMKEYRNLFNLDGRVALVVGAASGIGEACAHALAAFGAHVICADLNTQGATRTADAISSEGASAEAPAFHLTSPAS